jgi:hypothetical protein
VAFVYLLADLGKDYTYKIGVATGSVEKRVKGLQTGNAGEIHICKKFETDKPFLLEKFLHIQYGKDNVRGEWFELSDDDAMRFIELCETGMGILDVLKDNHFYKKKIEKSMR